MYGKLISSEQAEHKPAGISLVSLHGPAAFLSTCVIVQKYNDNKVLVWCKIWHHLVPTHVATSCFVELNEAVLILYIL